MRRAVIITSLALAGLAPLIRYHPEASSAATVVAEQSATPGSKVIDGPVEDTQFGPYQVEVTFDGKKITDVRIIAEPGDRRSQSIAGRAEPTLRSEALQAQSAKIDTVSGATITSEAYTRSLQAAIDANGS